MNNIEYFKKQVKHWSKRFRLGEITVCPDPHMWFVAFIGYKSKTLWYNSNQLRGLSKYELTRIVFHELGHFKHPVYNKNHKYEHWEYMLAEYLAEKQMFKWLKKYYPRYYKIELKDLKNRLEYILTYHKKYCYYFEAFSQIPEYAKHL